MLIEAHTLTQDTTIDADVVIVGSGAGGGTMARELVDAGYKVVLLEYGAYVRPQDFDQREDHMAERIEGVRGWLGSEDQSMFFTFCTVLGGTTVHYWADCEEIPDSRLELWHDKHGIRDLGPEKWRPYWARTGAYVNANLVPENLVNRNNQLVRAGAQKLGYKGHTVLQARKDCVGSGYCMLGCTYNRKQSQLVTNIPHCLDKGADVYTQCDVRKVLVENGRAVGVVASVIAHPSRKPLGKTVTVRAKTVVLAAGALNTPVILLRNALANGSGWVGRNLYCNPGLATYGLTNEDVQMFRGLPNAYTVDQFITARYDDAAKNKYGYGYGAEGYVEGGYIMLTSSTHPGYTAALSPSFGAEMGGFMKNYGKLISQYSVVDDEVAGRVRLNGDGDALYQYSSDGVDLLKERDFLVKSAEILFAAGASEVILPTNRGIRLSSPGDVARLRQWNLRPNDLAMAGPHPMGTAKMGSDPKASVCDLNCETHEVKNLFIADASVFPTSLAVDPSYNIMARAAMTADHIKTTRRPGT
jgi:choline dehydrogenase-like flavoprotein